MLGPDFEGLRSTVFGPAFEGLRGISSDERGVIPFGVISARSCDPPGFGAGEPSGESDGNDSSVFADVGVTREEVDVTRDCLRDFDVRTMPDLRDAVDVWDEVRSRATSEAWRWLAILTMSLPDR